MDSVFSIEFLRPEFFLLSVIALPVFAFVLREARFGRYLRVRKEESSKIPWVAVFQSLLASLTVLAMSAVLADPRHPFERKIEKKEGTDIVFVFDVSKSMLAEDLSPNRLDVAKRVIANFVAKREGDRMGLIVFAGKPFLVSPLTSDLEAFSTILSNVTTDSIRQEIPGLSGTNIGEGLLLASESLSGALSDKNVVLVTDGEANVGIDPKPVAKFLSEKGVKVHSIGIGDPNGIDLYVTDKATGQKTYFLGQDGKPIRAIVDAELMAYVSTTTSGTFANAKDEKGLEDIFEALNESTKKEGIVETLKTYSDAKSPFVVTIFCLLALFVLFSRIVSDDPSLLPLKSLPLAETSGNYRIRKRLRLLRRISFAAGLSFLVLASSGAFEWSISNIRNGVKEVVFVLDVSRSMDAVDPGEKTSRLDRAKAFIAKAVSERPNDRHSLIAFSGEAYEVVPPTSDSKAFLFLLSGITSKYAKTVGTDVTKALGLVSKRAAQISAQAEKKGLPNEADSALAVFLTDGGDAEDTPETSALRASYGRSDTRLETLSVTYGSEAGAPVPAGRDMLGEIVAVTDSKGEPVVSKANHETSKRISEATDGNSVLEKKAWSAYSDSLGKVMDTGSGERITETGSEISWFWILSLFTLVAAFVIQDKMPVGFKKPFSRAS